MAGTKPNRRGWKEHETGERQKTLKSRDKGVEEGKIKHNNTEMGDTDKQEYDEKRTRQTMKRLRTS